MAEISFTEAEIDEVITELRNAILAVSKRQTYSIDTGMGKQSVTYASIGSLERSLATWEWRKQQLRNSDSPFVSISGRIVDL